MPFWKCYYHVVWATKHREPTITAVFENVIIDSIRVKSAELRAPILAINTVSDHIHVATCIPPALSVGDWVGNIKGASSHAVNSAFPDSAPRFRWQGSYGVVTFGAKNLDFVTQYIERQKHHHAAGTLQPFLEQDDE